MVSYIEKEKIDCFFTVLNSSGIRYVLIKNIGDELPHKLIEGKDIDIVVHGHDKLEFENLMRREHFILQCHPWGVANGWKFMYGLPECQFWKIGNYEKNLLVDVMFKLCCKGMMPKTWIPLDRIIQERIWMERKWNKCFGWWDMDDETRFVYYMVRCIFDKQIFSEKYIEKIESVFLKVDLDVVRKLLKMVFFRYTDRLIYMIQHKRYNEIRQDYVSYADY